jgi:hypothetical protein
MAPARYGADLLERLGPAACPWDRIQSIPSGGIAWAPCSLILCMQPALAVALVAHCDTERTFHDARVWSISEASLTGVTAAAAVVVAERTDATGASAGGP